MLHIHYLDENNEEQYYNGDDIPDNLQYSYWNMKSEAKIHRKNGPAFYYDDYLHIEYFENGVNHRIDGPSEIIDGLSDNFYINGKSMYEKQFAEETNHLICKNCQCFCKQGCF